MPETRAKNYIQNTLQPYNKNKRTTQKNNTKQSTNSSLELNEKTLLETPLTNNKKQKVTSENMDTSSPKIVNKIIENIILTTDDNKRTPPNITDDNTNKPLEMDIDNVSSTSSTTEIVQPTPFQTTKDSMYAKQINNTSESKSMNTSSISKGKNKQT